jgi:hypothetical protein
MWGFFKRRRSERLLQKYDELALERVVSLGGEIAGLHLLIIAVASQLEEHKRLELVEIVKGILGDGTKRAPNWLDEAQTQIYRNSIGRMLLTFVQAHELEKSN